MTSTVPNARLLTQGIVNGSGRGRFQKTGRRLIDTGFLLTPFGNTRCAYSVSEEACRLRPPGQSSLKLTNSLKFGAFFA